MPSSFQSKCYELLRRIPKGRVTTYKILAEALDSRAYRAVGHAMAVNPDPIHTPCHRVVCSDGRTGQYAMGSDRKIALLRSEGVEIMQGRILDFEKRLYHFD
ncbi:MAG: MGMT family protein [Gammaproteobacteria bacterium]|nr:MAG: MGMT family protein [Gammaproteobacteria bacterium]